MDCHLISGLLFCHCFSEILSFNPFTFDRRFIMNWTTILCQIAIAAVTALANEAVKTIRENDKTDN